MPSTDVLIAFTTAALIMNLSPGPSNLYVMARAIAQGTKGGVVAAVGLAVGSLTHVIVTVLGLSVLFTHSPMLYTAVKLVGAAYLIYLGLSYWRTRTENNNTNVTRVKEKPFLSIFKESIIVEVTNPKTALFFIALLPQFVVPESGSVSQQLLVLGIIVTLSGLPCDILVAIASSKVSNWLSRNTNAQQIQTRVSGSILLAMGTYIIADETLD
jgi:threonine/homoserine/homoserine lactone efflux protein